MKLHQLIVAGGVVAAGLVGGAARAAQVPIDVSGFNVDAIVEVGGSFAGSKNATMDGGIGAIAGNTWYEQGFNTGAPTTGLPIGVVTSQSDSSTTFNIANPASNNVLMINAANSSGTLTLTTPAAYEHLSVFGSTGGGNQDFSYTVHFANATTASGSFTASDWFGNGPIAVTANGRVNESGFADVNTGNPRIYQIDLGDFAFASNIVSIDFTRTGGGGNTAFFGISGTAIPEPATLGLAGLLAPLALRRRRR